MKYWTYILLFVCTYANLYCADSSELSGDVICLVNLDTSDSSPDAQQDACSPFCACTCNHFPSIFTTSTPPLLSKTDAHLLPVYISYTNLYQHDDLSAIMRPPIVC